MSENTVKDNNNHDDDDYDNNNNNNNNNNNVIHCNNSGRENVKRAVRLRAVGYITGFTGYSYKPQRNKNLQRPLH